MKKQFFIFLILILSLCVINKNVNAKPDNQDCIEDGLCKSGIIYTIDDDTFTVNKENCLKHNRIWYENINACKF